VGKLPGQLVELVVGMQRGLHIHKRLQVIGFMSFHVARMTVGQGKVKFTHADRKQTEHLLHHLVTMAALNRAGWYDRLADGVERVTGRPAMSVRDFVALHAEEFGGRRA
jgi:hypothetical protein